MGQGHLEAAKMELMNFITPAVAVVVSLCFLLTLPPGLLVAQWKFLLGTLQTRGRVFPKCFLAVPPLLDEPVPAREAAVADAPFSRVPETC